MSDESTANGTDAEGRERPSWYVPIQPVPEDDHRTTQQVLSEIWGDEPLDQSEETQKELVAYLDQFRVPRES